MKSNKTKNLLEPLGIIVEGESDKKFITALCKHLGIENFQVEKISERGGKTDFFGKEWSFTTANIERLIAKEKINPKTIILICDADFKENGKSHDGYKKTKSTLQPIVSKLQKEYKNRTIDFFIIPNDEDDGNLDSLFLQSATSSIKRNLRCLDRENSYLECLGIDPSINKKDKLKARLLVSAIGWQKELSNVGDAAEVGGYWDFGRKENFEKEPNHPLNSLKEFLLKFKN